jgi:Thermostable hemolysin
MASQTFDPKRISRIHAGNRRDDRQPAWSTVQGTELTLVEDSDSSRAITEKYIASCFARKFGAKVPMYMPRLFSLRGSDGRIRGAVGLRHGEEPLYLEQYLNASIERVISRRAGRRCGRHVVAEVGHLCGDFPGVVRVLIDQVTKRLAGEGFQWVTFTGTRRLCNAFRRLGLSPIEIGPAQSQSVSPDDRVAWGRYYDESPSVYIGNVQVGNRFLSRPEAGYSLPSCER